MNSQESGELDFDLISTDTGVEESSPITVPEEIDYSSLRFAQYFRGTFIDDLARNFLFILIQREKNIALNDLERLQELVVIAFDLAEAYMKERNRRGIRV